MDTVRHDVHEHLKRNGPESTLFLMQNLSLRRLPVQGVV